ncbi:MAG: RNA polymerase sigma factor [Myxococcales bacterium]|nr:RNA polymerase sigma factor [Myxococcales bacterium]MCB9642075.1 RNA polymerase sigma factor [Myxococcales bacterium]
MQEISDNALMEAIKRGERAAFRRLFQRHLGPLQRFVYRFVGSAAVAEEMVQEIFFKIYRAAPAYEPRGLFTTYLYRVATNHCLNELRRADYKQRTDSLEQRQEQFPSGAWEPQDEQSPSPDEQLWLGHLTAQLQEFLLELPERQRAALLLYSLESQAYQEIAEVLDVSVSAVKSMIHRARQSLRQRFEVWNGQAEETP